MLGECRGGECQEGRQTDKKKNNTKEERIGKSLRDEKQEIEKRRQS